MMKCPMCSSEGMSEFWKQDISKIDLYKCKKCKGIFASRTSMRTISAADNWYDRPVSETEYLRVHEAAKESYFALVYDELIKSLDKDCPFRILDVGSGLGTFAQYLRSRNEQLQVIGIEPSWYAVEYARAHGNTTIHGELREGEYPFIESHYDAVVLFNVLEHVRDPQYLLQLCASVLKVSGEIIIRVPNISFHKLLFLFSRPNLNPNGHPNNFSFLALRLITEKTGLRMPKVLFEKQTTTIERPKLLSSPFKKTVYIITKRAIMHLTNYLFLLTLQKVNLAPTMLIMAQKASPQSQRETQKASSESLVNQVSDKVYLNIASSLAPARFGSPRLGVSVIRNIGKTTCPA